MGHVNMASLLVRRLHRGPSVWLCLHPRSSGGRIKLVRSDGSLEMYDRPVVVSELTRDFPKHKICRSDSLYIGQKTPALSESDTLKPGLSYFLLPSEFFQKDLTIAALKSPGGGGGGVLLRKTPFLIQTGEGGGRLRIRVSEDFMSQLMMEGRKTPEDEQQQEEEDERLCTTVKLKKDYVQLVSLRKWQPKLETIKETKPMKAPVKKIKRKRFPVINKRCKEDDSCNNKLLLHSKTHSSSQLPYY